MWILAAIDAESLTPDQEIWGHLGPWSVTATLGYSWLIMGLMVGGSFWLTRHLRIAPPLSRSQLILETLVTAIGGQIEAVAQRPAQPFFPLIATLFLFIAFANGLSLLPEPLYRAPTSALSTTSALAFWVALAVPYYGIRYGGIFRFLRVYLHPHPLMLPLNLVSEASRFMALAMRLFGNCLSDGLIAGILLMLLPLGVPVLGKVYGLLTGMIQAYIFAILAMVFITGGLGED